MIKDLKVGTVIGIYEVLDTNAPKAKDGHKQIHVKCVHCGLEKDTRPAHLGAKICNHKREIVPKSCKHCGEVIPYDSHTDAASYSLRVFCNSSCAAKCNSRRPHSEASKVKASKSLMTKYYGDNLELYEARMEARKQNAIKLRSIRNSSKYYANSLVEGQDYITCPYCSLRFSEIQSSHLKLHNKTFDDLRAEFGEDYKVVSDQTVTNKTEASKAVQQRLLDEGTHKGWSLRSTPSYAESYWMSVLESYGIEYKHEVPIWHGTANYFLDFVIERNGTLIDLEIDGKQHLYPDIITHDDVRNAFMLQQGYIVYRIPWNEIISEQGKAKMQSKIDAFLEFYNTI